MTILKAVAGGRLGQLLQGRNSLWLQFNHTRAQSGVKVTVIGANSSIGKPLSLMLKQSPWFEDIALHDCESTEGLAMELDLVDTNSKITPYKGNDGLVPALTGSHIVILTAGKTKKAGTSKEELFESNARATLECAKVCAKACPNAFLAIVTNPINSLVPLATEVYKKVNREVDHNRIFGVTTLDVVRTTTFLAELLSTSPENLNVPVIGGSSPATIVPVLSKTSPAIDLGLEERVKITRAVQGASEQVISNKGTSAVFSTAFAVSKFAIALSKAFKGQSQIIECAYVRSDAVPGTTYIATPIELGPAGLQKNYGVPELTEYEECLLETAIPSLSKDVWLGEKYAVDNLK